MSKQLDLFEPPIPRGQQRYFFVGGPLAAKRVDYEVGNAPREVFIDSQGRLAKRGEEDTHYVLVRGVYFHALSTKHGQAWQKSRDDRETKKQEASQRLARIYLKEKR